MEPQEDDFESFQVQEHLENLRAFQALSWAEKVKDLRDHVTRIYERDEILAAALLTYCSPRWIPFNKDTIRGSRAFRCRSISRICAPSRPCPGPRR